VCVRARERERQRETDRKRERERARERERERERESHGTIKTGPEHLKAGSPCKTFVEFFILQGLDI
jgi:hypothetical protein